MLRRRMHKDDFHPPAILPPRLKTPITREHAADAICGSVTDCSIARAIEDWLRKQHIVPAKAVKKRDFYIKVKPNRMMIRVNRVYHYYDMPDKGLSIVRQTDDDEYELIRETSLTFTLTRTAAQPNPATWQDPVRREQVNAARKQRAAEGRPDKPHRNERIEAAKRAGVHGKKLDPARRTQAA